jgi:hypothetical protein
MGLFLQGIEKPIILDPHQPNSRRSAPPAITIRPSLGHKRDLLGKVQTLYIVHHSSRTPEGSVYMVTRGKPRDTEQLEDHHADMLGSADLAGWKLARDLTSPGDDPASRHTYPFAYRKALGRLKAVCFGTWDDGRWNTYHEQALGRHWTEDADETATENGLNQTPSCPRFAFNDVLTKLLNRNQSYDSCYNARALVGLDCSFMSSRVVIHHAQLDTDFLNDRIRIYASTSSLQEHSSLGLSVGDLRLHYDSQMKPVFQMSHRHSYSEPDSGTDSAELSTEITGIDPMKLDGMTAFLMRKDIEICLVPEIEGDEGQLQLARDVRDALEVYEKASQEKHGTNGYLGKLKIFVDDDIPACPCCGGKR